MPKTIRVKQCPAAPNDPSLSYSRYIHLTYSRRGLRGNETMEVADFVHNAEVRSMFFEHSDDTVTRRTYGVVTRDPETGKVIAASPSRG